MPATAKPDVSTPWGVNGELTDPGQAKRQLGFVAEIPEYPEFNWIINNLGVFAKYLNEQGIGYHDTTTVYWVGGIVKGPDNKLYLSLQDNNVNHSVTDGAWWSSDFVGGGIRWSTKNANFAAESGKGYLVDGARVATLPAAPKDGDEIDFADYSGVWGATPSTVNGNGKNIEGSPSYSLNQNASMIRLVYSSTTGDWQVVTKAYESPHVGRAHNIRTNPQIIAEDLTLGAADNGGSFGPLAIQVGSTVTVNPGATWSIV